MFNSEEYAIPIHANVLNDADGIVHVPYRVGCDWDHRL